nr:cytochrome c3 family protein [Myxococcota bacterium]
AQRRATRLAVPWSARARFAHERHVKAADGSVLPCVQCHVDMTSPDVLQLAAPPKSTCAPCHDGRASFKLTGTTCTRCHAGAEGSRR